MERAVNEFWDKGGFALCTAGYADIEINDQKHRLTPGCIYVRTPLITISKFVPSPDYEEISFFENYKTYYQTFILISDTQYPLSVAEVPVWKTSDELSDEIKRREVLVKERTELLKKAKSDVIRKILIKQLELIRQETVLEVIYDQMSRFPIDDKNYDKNRALAYKFLIMVHQNYVEHRSVGWYAEQAKFSLGHFSAVIKKTLGLTPQQCIAKVVVSYAKFLLADPSLSIKEVAAILNFPA